MAGQPINLTRSITTLTPISGLTAIWQKGADALDVTGYPGARFDFSLKVYVISGTAPSVTATLYTSMYNDDNDSTWIELDAFTAVTTSNVAQIVSVTTGVLRYVRWKLAYNADMTLTTFEILGVAW